MNITQIAELLEPFLVAGPLATEQLEALSRYLELLLRWNARMNLTAVRDERNIVIRHFGESLFAAAKLLGGEASCSGTQGETRTVVDERGQRTLSIIDVGSGAGFPGLPIKIYCPQITLTLIESQNKKVTFLKEVIRTLRLQDASVCNGRAEDFELKADLVTLRAVEQFERVLPIAAGLVRSSEREVCQGGPGGKGESREATLELGASGRLALLIGASQYRVARTVLPEFAWDEPIRIPHSSERVLLVGRRKFGGV